MADDSVRLVRRSIPAYAGETRAHDLRRTFIRVDPRVCGGNALAAAAGAYLGGRSPRMRGKQTNTSFEVSVPGSIPAYAGETKAVRCVQTGIQVDPRVCGGNVKACECTSASHGRSPRMRGKLVTPIGGGTSPRSIPAYAGETGVSDSLPVFEKVDPRVCGGNRIESRAVLSNPGRSPRMRGKQGTPGGGRGGGGSIPAYAGETLTDVYLPPSGSVDPRVCGGNLMVMVFGSRLRGRSPRMRGKPCSTDFVDWGARSIPAYAGETCVLECGHKVEGVDPRVCGGNNRSMKSCAVSAGRSPRMRGKPLLGACCGIRTNTSTGWGGRDLLGA